MLKAEHLKGTPARQFAQGDGFFPDLHPTDRIRWVATWNGNDWRIRVSPATKDFKEVAEKGRVVDLPKIIYQLIPCSDSAMELYFK